MPFTQRAVLDWLDACGVPFRKSMELAAQDYGIQPQSLFETVDDVVLPMTSPLLPDLTSGPVFLIPKKGPADRPPSLLTCYIRKHRDTFANVAVAQKALSALFGRPTHKERNNAILNEWSDPAAPFCKIMLYGFPPEDQDPNLTNTMHDRIPGSKTQATIYISPDWAPPLTPHQETALSRLAPLLNPADHAAIGFVLSGWDANGRHRAVPKGLRMEAGLWATGDADLFALVSSKGRFALLERAHLLRVDYHNILPGKGPGSVQIELISKLGASTTSWPLARANAGTLALDPLAQRIAQGLDLPLKRHEYYDA